MPPSAYLATPRLRTWREYVALSQAELARGAGVSASTIARLEHGGHTSAAIVQRLTTFLQADHARFACSDEAVETVDITACSSSSLT
jgi:transcriptional regulator with XRE-family HTH domain